MRREAAHSISRTHPGCSVGEQWLIGHGRIATVGDRWDNEYMTMNESKDEAARAERAARHTRNLALAIHSAEMEGGHVSDAFLHEAREYANGMIDAATLGRRVRAHYGIGSK